MARTLWINGSEYRVVGTHKHGPDEPVHAFDLAGGGQVSCDGKGSVWYLQLPRKLAEEVHVGKVTDEQIEKLLDEALTAGDDEMATICNAALDEESENSVYRGHCAHVITEKRD